MDNKMDKKMKPVNTAAIELTENELEQASGGAGGATLDFCCNPSQGGCGNLVKLPPSVNVWRCSCGRIWTFAG